MLEEYLMYLEKIRRVSSATLKAYGRDLGEWGNFLSAQMLEVSEATQEEAGHFVSQIRRQGLSAPSVNRILSTLRGFYQHQIRRGLGGVNPFGEVKNLKVGRKLPVFMFEKEVVEILSLPTEDGFFGLRDRLILELLYATGCRISELTGASLKDFSGDQERLKVVGKGDKERWVFLTQGARRALIEYIPLRETYQDPKDSDAMKALFLNRFGKRLANIGFAQIVEKYIRKSGIAKRVTPHTFRHTFATHLMNQGLDIRVVQEFLGHSHLSTTQVYTHLGIQKLKDIYNKAHPHGGAVQEVQ